MVTITSPLAPAAIWAVIVFEFTILKEAGLVPPNLTEVAPVKLLPEIVTVVPVPAVRGETLLITGASTNVKMPAEVPIPSGPVTVTDPVVPVLTIAEIELAELIVNEVAGVPPKLTAEAPKKLVPVMIIEPFAPVLVGLNEVIVGGGRNVNPVKVVVIPATVTATFPVAPAPTTAFILVGETTVKEAAGTPPKLTLVAPVKFTPVMVIVVPLLAVCGVNEEMIGSVILLVKTEILPVEAFADTISGKALLLRSPITKFSVESVLI